MMKLRTDLRSIGAAALVFAAGPAGAAPACDAVKAALAGDHKTFARKMQETYPQLNLESCTFKDKARFVCMAEFNAADAVEIFGASTFEAIVTNAGAPFVACGATLHASERYEDALSITLKVPSGARTAMVAADAYLWEGDPDDLNLDIEVK